MFTKLLIAASTLLLIAYGMEPDDYGAQRRSPVQHASVSPISVSSTPAAPYRA
jgi:hypothetical protein